MSDIRSLHHAILFTIFRFFVLTETNALGMNAFCWYAMHEGFVIKKCMWLYTNNAHSGTYSYRSLLIQMFSLSLKMLDKTDNR